MLDPGGHDNWDRHWFLALCEKGFAEMLEDVDLQDHVGSFNLVYRYQGDGFRFVPFGPVAQRPTWAMFGKVVDALKEQVLEPFVAHDMQFNLVDGQGLPLGVGYFEVYKQPDPDHDAVTVLSSNSANFTIGVTTRNDFDWRVSAEAGKS